MQRLTIITIVVLTLFAGSVSAIAPPGAKVDADVWLGFGGSPYDQCVFGGADAMLFPSPSIGFMIYADGYKGTAGDYDFSGHTLAAGVEARLEPHQSILRYLHVMTLYGVKANEQVDNHHLFMARIRANLQTWHFEATGQWVQGGDNRVEVEIGPEWWRQGRMFGRIGLLYIHDEAKEMALYERDYLGGIARWDITSGIELQGRLLWTSDKLSEDDYWSGSIAVSFSPFYFGRSEGAR